MAVSGLSCQRYSIGYYIGAYNSQVSGTRNVLLFAFSLQPIATQQAWDIDPMLCCRWANTEDNVPTLNKHLVNITYVLRFLDDVHSYLREASRVQVLHYSNIRFFDTAFQPLVWNRVYAVVQSHKIISAYYTSTQILQCGFAVKIYAKKLLNVAVFVKFKLQKWVIFINKSYLTSLFAASTMLC